MGMAGVMMVAVMAIELKGVANIVVTAYRVSKSFVTNKTFVVAKPKEFLGFFFLKEYCLTILSYVLLPGAQKRTTLIHLSFTHRPRKGDIFI